MGKSGLKSVVQAKVILCGEMLFHWLIVWDKRQKGWDETGIFGQP